MLEIKNAVTKMKMPFDGLGSKLELRKSLRISESLVISQ
jgi:hypothetical protein